MIQVAFFMEMNPEMAANTQALAIAEVMAEKEAAAHGYKIIGSGEVGPGRAPEVKQIVWVATSALD